MVLTVAVKDMQGQLQPDVCAYCYSNYRLPKAIGQQSIMHMYMYIVQISI